VSVALVTDSTAYLSRKALDSHGIRVVPLHVVIGGREYSEGVDVSAGEVASALRRYAPVSTSRPAPRAFLECYEEAAAAGADEIVSVHISADMSSTIESAQLAAQKAPVPVSVVDSRSMGMAMGYAVLAAADAAVAGASGPDAAEVARRRAEGATVIFYVDTLEHLRRGGRIGAASALLGSALAIKPILALAEGQIHPLERVRTSTRALSRIEDLAVAAAEAAPDGVDIAVHHLDSQARADDMASRLQGRLSGRLAGESGELVVVELGAVVGAHVGPGTLAVVVSPRLGE
jgi:DegV family protein with EDD domain